MDSEVAAEASEEVVEEEAEAGRGMTETRDLTGMREMVEMTEIFVTETGNDFR